MYPIKKSEALDILIFAFDINGDPVTGLVDGNWTKRISKNGGAFSAMSVTITEREGGWYLLPISASHTDTLGVLSMYFNATGIKQQNIQFRVSNELIDDLSVVSFPAGALDFTYVVTDSSTTFPIEGVEIWFSTDIAGLNVVWSGNSDVFGVARDVNGQLPKLDAGTYYVWRQLSGYTFSDPDVEVVS